MEREVLIPGQDIQCLHSYQRSALSDSLVYLEAIFYLALQ